MTPLAQNLTMVYQQVILDANTVTFRIIMREVRKTKKVLIQSRIFGET